MSSLRGFTLIELMLSTAIIAILASVIFAATGPRTIIIKAKDVSRKSHTNQLMKGLSQLQIEGQSLAQILQFPTESGAEYARPICKAGMLRDSGCVNLDILITSEIMSTLPEDNIEPCEAYSGYEVYRLQEAPYAIATHLGKTQGDTLIRYCTLDTLAPEISNVQYQLVASTAIITWETDEIADGQMEYGLSTSYGNRSTLNPTAQLLHNELLEGLLPYTTYHFRVLSRDPSGNLHYSDDYTFTTDDTTEPQFTEPPIANVTENGATITWTTDEASDSQVEYGLTSSYTNQSSHDATDVTSHTRTITGLTPNTTYHYQIRSRDSMGNLAQSIDYTFTTLPDQNPPVIADIATLITGNSLTISWTTNESADAALSYGTSAAYGSIEATGSTLQTSHSITITGLILDTLYHYQIESTDAAGNTGTSSNQTVAITDVTPPTISGIATSGITYTDATISWTTNENSTTQIEYGTTTAYGNTSTLNSTLTTSHSQIITGLVFSTTYHYRILVRDAAGNTSTSPDQTFTTSNSISAVTVTGLGASTATVNWTTAISSNTQVQYGTTTAMTSNTALNPAMVTTGHTSAITGLIANTLYYYRAKSVDALNRTATYDGTFTTLGDTTAPTISAVAWTNRNTTTPTVTWNTNEAANTEVEYGLTTSYGSTTGLNASMVTPHSVTMPALTMNTTYFYRIRSLDAAGNLATSAGSINVENIPPVQTLPPTTSGLTGNGVTINWTVNESSTPQVDYGLTTSYGSSTAFGASSTNQSRPITGLVPNTTYHYRVRSRDVAGNTTLSGDYTFTTDITAPTLSSIASSAIGNTTATVSWTSNESSNTQVEYGTTTSYGTTTTIDSTLVTSHSANITGLTSNTQYHYRVKSQDAAGNLATSANFTFTTTDTIAPLFSAITDTPVSDTSSTIAWTTDEAATSQVEYGLTTSYGATTTLDSAFLTSHSQTLTGLARNTTYHYRVKSRDAAGNLGTSSDATLTTPDTTPPVLSSILSSNITSTTATVSWSTDETSDTQVEYGTTTSYGSTTILNTSAVTNHSQTITGLLPSTAYHYRVKSNDASNNLAVSSDKTFTTAGDTTPPTLSGVSSETASPSSVTINWSTNEGSTTQVEYGTTTGYGILTTIVATPVTSHSETITGLTPNIQYHYRVRSKDSANNESVSSNYTFTIIDNTPPVITIPPSVPSVTATTATVRWTTDENATTQIEYGLTTAYNLYIVDASLVTSHEHVLTGLSQDVTYHYRVKSRDAAGSFVTSGDYTFQTDGTPPLISAVSATASGSTTMIVQWTTNETSTSQVDYGGTTSYGSSTSSDTLTKNHTQILSNLTPATLYHYRIRSTDAAQNQATSADFSFSTP